MIRPILLGAGLALALVTGSVAQAQQIALGRDLFASGREIDLRGEIRGDAMVAGGRVTTGGTIAGDLVAAGGELAIDGRVADDLYAAGGDVRIGATVGGSARVAGGEVRIAERANIADGLSAAGGRIAIDGTISGYAQLAGGSLRIDGRVDGDVVAAGGELRIGPRAVIGGSVVFRGPQPAVVAEGAQIRGGVRNITQDMPGRHRVWPAAATAIALVWWLGWVVVGALLIGIFPHATRRVTHAAAAHVGLAALVGFIAVVVGPVLVVLLFATLIGIPLALLALATYLLLLGLGWLAGLATLGDAAFARMRGGAFALRTWGRLAAFVIAALVVAIVGRIPVLGWVVGLLLCIVGVGALLRVLAGRGALPAIGPGTPA